jgi:1,4-alpha-glucan branching enzyme
MPGNEFQKFANLRLLYGCMYLHMGAKLNFMGNEFAQTNEWNYDSELQWELLQYQSHNGMQEYIKKLNYLYNSEPALYEWQFDKKGFKWEDISNSLEGVMVFRRICSDKNKDIVVILNVSNNNYSNWKINLKGKNQWKEVLNSDASSFWGSGNHMNTNILFEVVDKKKKINIIKLNISAFSVVVIR